MSQRRVIFSRLEVLLGLLVVLIIAGSIWIFYLNRGLAKETVINSQPAASSPACTIKGVPASLCVKAKSLGYYCPSWDARPGQIVPDYCYKVQ